MIKLNLKVNIEEGLHSRYAIKLVEIVKGSDSTVKMVHKGNVVNPRSIISILSSCIVKDDIIEFEITGKDEVSISDMIKEIFE